MSEQTNPWTRGRARRPRSTNLVWKFSRELCLEIYELTRTFPDNEMYGLTSQLRRASVSVMSNVVEGAARRTTRSYLSFLYTARGSLEEIDAQLDVAGELGYLAARDLTKAIDTFENLSRTLQGLINSLEDKVGPRNIPGTK